MALFDRSPEGDRGRGSEFKGRGTGAESKSVSSSESEAATSACSGVVSTAATLFSGVAEKSNSVLLISLERRVCRSPSGIRGP